MQRCRRLWLVSLKRGGLTYSAIGQTLPCVGQFEPFIGGLEALALLGPLFAFGGPGAVLVSGYQIHSISPLWTCM